MTRKLKTAHPSARNRSPNIRLFAEVFVGYVIFRTNENSAWTISPTGNSDQEMCTLLKVLRVLANDMIQSKI